MLHSGPLCVSTMTVKAALTVSTEHSCSFKWWTIECKVTLTGTFTETVFPTNAAHL